jgi:hypothetical protein
MSVPLDRLYNFLRDVCNHRDLIIYRFYPHGSKKLEDLMLFSGMSNWSWVKKMSTPSLIFHDQEPLNFNLYSRQDFFDYITNSPLGYRYPDDDQKNHLASMHLRTCIQFALNVYDQTLLCHSEQNSKELDLYKQHRFVGVYYWSHALIARDWYRYAKIDPGLTVDFENITHDFLIYNRAWSGTREYRLAFLDILTYNNLHSYCKTKFSEWDFEQHYAQHKFQNPNLSIVRKDLHEFYQPNTSSPEASADYSALDYNTTAIEVVLETLFDDSRHHLTEKALRPIACGRPFILAATAGSLQYLKQYGFKTFDGLIDETYDSIQDPRMRLEAIVQEIKRISSLDHDQKRLLWAKLYAIAEHNRRLFFSDAWHDLIVNEFKNNLDLAINTLTATGKCQKEQDRLALSNPALLKIRTSDSPFNEPTLADRRELESWVKKKNSVV